MIAKDLLVNGVSRFIGKIYGNLHGNVTVPICECTTAAGTAAKTADCEGFVLEEGAKVQVHFTNTNTVANPTLNINGTGAKAIYRYGTTAPSTSVATSWPAGAMISFTYDGSYWFMDNWTNTDTNTHYTTHLYAGTGTAANAATVSPKITLTDDSTVRNSVTIQGDEHTIVTSDTSGKITVREMYRDPPLIDGVYCGEVEGFETIDGNISIPIKQYEINRYCECSTAANAAAKTATMGNGELELSNVTGAKVTVKFANKNTADYPTLNIDSTGAKNIFHNGARITTGSNKNLLYGVCDFVYDGTQWCLVGNYIDTNTTYTNLKLGQGYGTCSTAEATTAKVASVDPNNDYVLHKGGIVSIRFTYNVPASSTLKINNGGVIKMKFNNADITAGIIKAGDTATFIYDGTSGYHLIAIDRWATDINDHEGRIDALETVSYTREVIVKNTNISGTQITWYCKKYGDKTVDCYGVVRPTLSNYGTLSVFFTYSIEVDLPYTMDNTNYHADASWKIAGGLVMNGGDRISYSTTKMRTYAVSPLSGSQSCDISIHLTGLMA